MTRPWRTSDGTVVDLSFDIASVDLRSVYDVAVEAIGVARAFQVRNDELRDVIEEQQRMLVGLRDTIIDLQQRAFQRDLERLWGDE